MYYKIILCILLVVGCGYAGWVRGNKIKKIYDELHYIKKIIMLLKGEIQYNRNVLSSVFEGIADRIKEPYGSIFFNMAKELNMHRGESFNSIWKDNLIKYVYSIGCKEKDVAPLLELGENMGYLDMQMQINIIDLFLDKQELILNEYRQTINDDIKLCRVLGIAAGLFLAILIV